MASILVQRQFAVFLDEYNLSEDFVKLYFEAVSVPNFEGYLSTVHKTSIIPSLTFGADFDIAQVWGDVNELWKDRCNELFPDPIWQQQGITGGTQVWSNDGVFRGMQIQRVNQLVAHDDVEEATQTTWDNAAESWSELFRD